jgi:hypothetical protein
MAQQTSPVFVIGRSIESGSGRAAIARSSGASHDVTSASVQSPASVAALASRTRYRMAGFLVSTGAPVSWIATTPSTSSPTGASVAGVRIVARWED